MPTLPLLLSLAAALLLACTDLSSVEFPTKDELQKRTSSSSVETKLSSSSSAKSSGSTVPSSSSIARSSSSYESLKIGNIYWMAQNLDLFYYQNDTPCYQNSQANCNTYGKLYNWAAAKNVCPYDWRLPKDSEFEALKEDNNLSKFAALSGGKKTDSIFVDIDSVGYWWSDSEDNNKAKMYYIKNDTMGYELRDKAEYCSVRCVKDEE